jgi:hypothetical protein
MPSEHDKSFSQSEGDEIFYLPEHDKPFLNFEELRDEEEELKNPAV